MSFSPVFSYRPHIGWRKTLQPLARVTVSDEEDTHQCLHDFSHLICLTPSTNPSSKGQQQHQQQQQQKSWNIKKRKKKEGTAWLGTPPPLAIFPQHSNPFKSIQIHSNQWQPIPFHLWGPIFTAEWTMAIQCCQKKRKRKERSPRIASQTIPNSEPIENKDESKQKPINNRWLKEAADNRSSASLPIEWKTRNPNLATNDKTDDPVDPIHFLEHTLKTYSSSTSATFSRPSWPSRPSRPTPHSSSSFLLDFTDRNWTILRTDWSTVTQTPSLPPSNRRWTILMLKSHQIGFCLPPTCWIHPSIHFLRHPFPSVRLVPHQFVPESTAINWKTCWNPID